MITIDPTKELLRQPVIPADEYDGTDSLTGIDISHYAGNVAVNINHSATATGTVTIKIQESDAKASGYSDIDGKSYVIDGAAGLAAIKIDPRATKRYIRATVTAADSGAAEVAADAIGSPKYQNTAESIPEEEAEEGS